MLGAGWPSEEQRMVFLRLRRDWATGLDPFFAACLDLMRRERRLITRLRRDLISDQQWYDSKVLNEHFTEAGLDDVIGSYCPLSGGGCHAIIMGRRASDPPFELRHCRLVHLLHHGISLHFGKPLAMLGAYSADGLSPRMRQVLSLLCVGDSEKQVAVKLGISPHTVHTYIKRLHKHFDVASRGELLARTRVIAPDPEGEPSPPPDAGDPTGEPHGPIGEPRGPTGEADVLGEPHDLGGPE